MSARRLSHDEYWRQARDAYGAVFGKQLPPRVFRRSIQRRTLLVTDRQLSEDEYLALENAAAAVGDSSFYLRFDIVGDRSYSPWKLQFGDFRAYEQLDVDFANRLHSPTGAWGIYLDWDFYGLAGGSDAFIETLLEAWSEHELRFARGARKVGRKAWMPLDEVVRTYSAAEQAQAYVDLAHGLDRKENVIDVLAYVYGRAEAERLCKAYVPPHGPDESRPDD